jgi:N-acetylated-alpha-linked acidic dipeptidase
MHRRAASTPAVAVILGALAASPVMAQDDRPDSPLGFLPGSRAAEARAEADALAVPVPEKARAWLRTLTEEPHVAGTPADHKTALFVRDKLRDWGWQADLAEYEVLLNYPDGTPRLEVVRPSARSLPVIEESHPADKDSASPDAFPAFHGYGVSGDVTGQVVYANFGRPEDFDALEKMGVEVKDKLVLVRYGAIFRGLKVLNAQKRHARGVLIFSDPADDGYAKGDIYPNGPFRSGSAIQRGSVQFLSLGPGDPSTPNGPSIKGVKRLPINPFNGFPIEGISNGIHDPKNPDGFDPKRWEKATGLDRDAYYATIPSLPISFDAARPILEGLGGPNVPSGWQGALPLAYHVGPGPAEVHFAIQMDYKVRTIWNVIATLKGSAEPERWVMISNHRDAWAYGAVDPGSGTAATLEMCRALGAAVKGGWKPRRTIVYASWDAEEYGLVGSTEWAEDHARELDEKAVLMLNVDSAVSGPDLDVSGVPSLRDLFLEAADGVTDPRSGKTLRRLWVDRRRASWANEAPIDLDETIWADPDASPPSSGRFHPQLTPLGSGSDYTAFLDHLGIPALDVGFHGHYGVYHSIFDNFFWMEKFGDPEFLTHATAAKLYTLIAMRAAGAEVVPLRFVAYGDFLRAEVDDLRRIIARKARAAGPDASKPPLKFEGLADLVRAVREFSDRAAAADRATADLVHRGGVEPAQLSRVNDALLRVERALLHPDGLPGRPWFKHVVFAPGVTTGYACWPLPGVRQAILGGDPALLAAQLPILNRRLAAASTTLRAVEQAAGRR